MRNLEPDRILMSGTSGLIGLALRQSLRSQGIKIVQLVRGPHRQMSGEAEEQIVWDPYKSIPIDSADLPRLEGLTAAIHLSGSNLSGHRWTATYKKSILESRVQSTTALARILAAMRIKPSVLLCASAVGIYGNRVDEPLDEKSALGSGFLAEVCKAWEQATQSAEDAGIRVVHMRFGVVLSPQGGALASMLPVFRAGLGARLGSGRQWLSWIAISDLVRAIEFFLREKQLSGAVNLVAPEPVRNSEFTRALAKALGRPAFLAVPAFALKLALGEMADDALLASQRVYPRLLQSAGFDFQHPGIQDALRSMLQNSARQSTQR
jgi:uncharacterized protein